jgi:hypothetical protein
LKGIRNDIGGHFGHTAALNALSILSSEECGSIAGGDDAQLKLHLAGEIATTALLKHLPDHDVAKFDELFRGFILSGYRYAIDCVAILVREFLWERFRS